MGQLAYELQLPEDFDVSVACSALIADIAEEIMTRNWNGIDQAVKNAEGYPPMSGVNFYDWLREIWPRRNEAVDVAAGINLRLHALECATDYIDYLMCDWV